VKKPIVFITCICFLIEGFSQMGGKHAYEFLNLVSSPKVAALGGKYISSVDNDLSLAYHNPSLLNEQMQNHVTLNYVKYFAGVNYGYVAYGGRFQQKNTVSAGMQYVNYGSFIGADENGTKTGSFTAAEYALNLAFAHKIDSFLSVGADVRPILSIYEKYKSFGLSTDLGITYYNPHKLYTLALVLRNLGSQIKPYYDLEYESLPFEIQAGYTQQLKYAPFRLMVTAQHLELPEISIAKSEDENSQLTSEINSSKKEGVGKIADQIMRHLIFGIEFLPFKNFYIRAGYNYQRRQELKIDTHASTVGFSWGFGLSISRFQISYGRATYHVAGASNHFSVATNLSTFYKKRVKTENI
jgi:hypothetical protein